MKPPSRKGSPEYFIGEVWVDPLLAQSPMDLQMFRVHFAPGARTAWHTHPKGQVLHVLSGTGWYQKEGETVQTMQAGDTIMFLANQKHWHGASSENHMVHLAIQQEVDGVAANWLEQVSDSEYRCEATHP